MNPVRPTLPHHTLSDWGLSWMCLIDPTQFISPPTSLSFQHGTSCHAGLGPPLGLNVPYGRLTLGLYCVPASPFWFPRTRLGFRVPAGLAPILTNHCYYIQVWHTPNPTPPFHQIELYRIDNGHTLLASWAWAPPLNVWTFFRILFIPGCTAGAFPTLNITIQYWDGANWTTIGAFSDPTDSWAQRGDNSIGFYLQDDQHWLDEVVLMELL